MFSPYPGHWANQLRATVNIVTCLSRNRQVEPMQACVSTCVYMLLFPTANIHFSVLCYYYFLSLEQTIGLSLYLHVNPPHYNNNKLSQCVHLCNLFILASYSYTNRFFPDVSFNISRNFFPYKKHGRREVIQSMSQFPSLGTAIVLIHVRYFSLPTRQLYSLCKTF